MPDNLSKLLQEIHSVKTPTEMSSKYPDFKSRIALLIFLSPQETNYYRNHTGREFFRKLYNFKLYDLITDTYDSGFRPDVSSGIRTFSVSLNGNNGTESGAGNYLIGASVNIAAVPDPCYKFDNWTLTGPGSVIDPTGPTTQFTVGAGDSTITANYSLKTFSVTANGDNGVESISDFSGVCGDTISISATPDDCYQFDSWTLTGPGSIADTSSASTTFTIGAGNATLTANYSLKSFTISSNGANGTETLSDTSGQCDDEIHISADPDDCYQFDSWTLTGPGTIVHATNQSTKFIIGPGDATLTANYSLKTFHISANGDNGTETLSSTTGVCGDTISISATPESGFQFDSWTLTGSGSIADASSASTTFTVGGGNAELTANYSST